MLRYPRWLPDIGAESRARLWTADCRHEIDAALRTATSRDQRPGYQEVSRELQRRMLRVPGWAAHQVGWPFGHWAQSYLERLAATTVTEGAARRAFHTLALDAQQRTGVAGPAHGGNINRRAMPAAGREPAAHDRPEPGDCWRREQAAFLEQLGPGVARPDSLGSRMRIQQPRL
jgi:hypothetical protein